MEEDDSDIWTSDGTCVACRLTFKVEHEKLDHRDSKKHIQKWNLHKFFSNEVTLHETNGISQMLERYKLKKIPVIGLNFCHEIQQVGLPNQEKANFWTCGTCYEVGANYESADAHLTSMEHIRNYMDECESDEKERIEEECADDLCEKYERYLAAAEKIFHRDGGTKEIQPPTILRIPLSTSDGKNRFGIQETAEVTFQPCGDEENRSVLHCSTCNDVVPVHTIGKHTNEKARVRHCETPSHQKNFELSAIIKEFNPQEVFDEYKTAEEHADLHWVAKHPNEWYLSQPCGLRYSIKAGKETVCTICFSLVESQNLIDHFSSESHAMKYLNMIHSYQSYQAKQLSGSARRAKALTILTSTYTLENDTKQVVRSLSRLPNSIKSKLAEDVHIYPDAPNEIIDDFQESTGKIFRFCHSCSTFIEFEASIVETPEKMEISWRKHVMSDEHFKTAAVKARIFYDPSYLVPYAPTIVNNEADVNGLWTLNKDVLVQTQCDVGLEYMVEDEKANEVTCQCCWQILSKNPLIVNQHVRSYDHLKQYIFHTAPDLVRILLGPEKDVKKQEFILDWLKRHSGLFHTRINLYSKQKTLELSSWDDISSRTVQLASIADDSNKDVYETMLDIVDKISNDGAESETITAREALIAARMIIINTSRGLNKELSSVVCKCDNCDLHIVVNAETWQHDVFDTHVCTAEHHRRTKLCKENVVNAFGVLPEKSTYTVKPYIQKDATKKVVWQWNQNAKQHEFVAGVVGLDDIIERRYPGEEFGIPKKNMDFFCQLCAKVFPKRATALESHVRELDHCVNWVHKYRPSTIRELQDHLLKQIEDKGKDLRKFLSVLLKDIHPSEDYCIRVYDPMGEEEKKQMLILQKIQAEEKTRRLAEAKEKLAADTAKYRQQQEERMREQEERNKTERQKRMEDENRRREKEKQRQAEREARLQYAKANATKFTASNTAEDYALQSRLQYNSMLEKQNIREKLDVQKARLEAERIQLISKGPPRDPQLVIMPQVKSQPIPAPNPFGLPSNMTGVPPPGISVSNPTPRFNQHPELQTFGLPPPPFQPSQPPPGAFMTFGSLQQNKELPAFAKRPSLRGKQVDMAIHNVLTIKNKSDLLTYMRNQGATEILDPKEFPKEFSQAVEDSPDAFGIDFIAEVVCLDDPSLDSYLCTVCDAWVDPKGMLRHLCTTDHKTAYLFHKYPAYHAEVMREKSPVVRREIFKNFTRDLKSKAIGTMMKTRMKTLIDKATIERLWPGYEEYFGNKEASASAWSSEGFQPIVGATIVLPKVVPVAPLLLDDSAMDVVMDIDERPSRKNESSKIMDHNKSRDRSRRSRSREHRRRRSRTRSRSRSRSRDRYHRDRRDRRSRSRSKSRSRSRSRERQRSRQSTWSEQTSSFLAKLQEKPSGSSSTPSKSPAGDFSAKLATVRDLTNSGVIQGTSIEGLSSISSTAPVAAAVQPTQSTEERRRLNREKEENELNIRRKLMAAMMMMEHMLVEYNGNVPRDAVLRMYESLGLDPVEGDGQINMMLDDLKKQNAKPKPTNSISESIMSMGFVLNSSESQVNSQASHYQQPTVTPAVSQPSYGISSGTPASSAYSQTFNQYHPPNRPLSPISAAIIPMTRPTPQVSQAPPQTQQQQPFYLNPPTSISHNGIPGSSGNPISLPAPSSKKPDVLTVSDDSSDDDEYSEVYELLGKDKVAEKKKKKLEAEKKTEEPMIPGQKMALKRTILPSGARVGEPESNNSPAPSDASSSVVPVTPANQPAVQVSRPPLESSLGMPAPIAVTAPGQMSSQQQPQVSMYQQQVYQTNAGIPYQQPQQHPIYQHPQQISQPGQYQQPMYQQPQGYPPTQFGVPQPIYQQPQQQPQQYGYPPQQVYQQPIQQYPQQQPQQFYQPAPQQQPPQSYGIPGSAQQQYFWPQR